MKNIHGENLDSILKLLDERLALTQPGKTWRLVVCGGSALNALGLVARTTKDVDVIGRVVNKKIDYADFDVSFLEQTALCAKVFELPANWLNTGPESFIQSGLPNGLLKRLSWKRYGRNLHIGYISRLDQIFLKLYAAVDRGGYHVDDLSALQPTEKELLEACKWSCEQDVSEGFAILLRSMLNQLGYADVAGQI